MFGLGDDWRLVAILDLLRLSKNSSWFEVRFLESNVLHRCF